MKKLISLALAIFMILSLATVAFAADERPTSGTSADVRGTITINDITIKDGKPAATYAIYQILKLNSYDFTTGSYFYDYTDDAWKDFFTTGDGKNYVALNDKDLLEWKGSSDADRVADFAKLALQYAKANDIDPTKTTVTEAGEAAQYTVSGDNSIVFEDLQLGYYLVDSSVGALCGLSTTNPDGIINSKNGAPTLIKQVQEDLGEQWGKSNTADIGQEVKFLVTIHVHDGAQNYVLHDIMEAGLTFIPGSVSVKLIDGTGTEADKTLTRGVDYEVITENIGDETFRVRFFDDCCDELNTNDRLLVNYSATLNENAEIGNGTAENPANENRAHLHYGDGHLSNEDATTTKTYGIDLVKTDGQNKLLDGAKFRIYGSADGNDEIAVLGTTDGYRRAADRQTGDEINVVDGKVRIVGLDNGTYWLEETKAPDGYNAISSRQRFTIADNSLDAIITNDIVSTNSGVQVVNNTGSMLPETGGLGTLLFTVLGSTTALGTGVVLVTKKRMSKIEDEE